MSQDPSLKALQVYYLDPLKSLTQIVVGQDGMKIDRKLFERFSKPILDDPILEQAVKAHHWEKAVQIMRDNYANRPEDYVTLEKLMQNEKLDRRLNWKEVLDAHLRHDRPVQNA